MQRVAARRRHVVRHVLFPVVLACLTSCAFAGSEDDNSLGLKADMLRQLFFAGRAFRTVAHDCRSLYELYENWPDTKAGWPTSIDELYRNKPEEWGGDPFSDERLRLVVDPQDKSIVRIWSFGPDGDWDDGRQIDAADPTLDGDIGLELSTVQKSRWLVPAEVRTCLLGRRCSHALAAMQPEVGAPVFPSDDAQYVWGDIVDGLQAALVLVPEQGVYAFGQTIRMQIRVRNAGRRVLQVASETWRQDVCRSLEVTDERGFGVRIVSSAVQSGISPVRREALKPGETAVFENSGLVFVSVDRLDEGSAGNTVACSPGIYRNQYRLRFPEFDAVSWGRGDGAGDHVPQPEDWQGILPTGVRRIVVGEAPSAAAP